MSRIEVLGYFQPGKFTAYLSEEPFGDSCTLVGLEGFEPPSRAYQTLNRL